MKNDAYVTPIKSNKMEKYKSALSKKKETKKVNEWNASERKPLTSLNTSLKMQSSPFYIPYIVL